MARNKRQVRLAHPGEILNEEFLKPLGMTINALAMALHVPGNRLYAIVEGARGISPEYGVAARPLLRHRSGILGQPSGALRP
jgi:addiction module HigA family antidote